MRKIFGYILTLIALVLMGIGLANLYQTQIRILNSVPTPVRIKDKRLEHTKDTDSHMFVARVYYSYNANGEIYPGDKVLPYDIATPAVEYLEQVIEPYKIGEVSVAYYNSTNPADSFLRKSIPYPPYMMILSALFLLITGLFVVMTSGRKKMVEAGNSSGWFQILAGNTNLVEMQKATKVQAIIFSAVSVLTFAHYFMYAVRPYGIWEISSVCVFLIIGSLLWKQALEYKRKVEELGDLHLELDSPRLEFGKEYKARIRQTVKKPADILSIDLGVTCHKGSVNGEELNQIWYQIPYHNSLLANEEIKVEQVFMIPLPDEIQDNNKLAYSLEARVKSKNGMQEWSFPVLVYSGFSEPK